MTAYYRLDKHDGAGYGDGRRANYALWAIVGTIVRPGATIKAISDAPDRYLVSSVAVIAGLCFLYSVPDIVMYLEHHGSDLYGSRVGLWAYSHSLIDGILRIFLFIAVIFWVGNRYGRGRKFTDVFPVLSYCLIPTAVGTVAILGVQSFELTTFLPGGMPDTNAELSPTFALDFAGASSILLVQNAVSISITVWVFILFIKAAKILCGFGTGRAIGVVLLATAVSSILATAFNIAYGFFSLFV